MCPFPGAIGWFWMHGAGILPSRAVFRAEGPEIMHSVKMLPACDRNTACAPTPHPLCRALPTPRPVRRSRHRALPTRDRLPAALCLGDAPQPAIAPVGMRSPPSSPCPAPRCPCRVRTRLAARRTRHRAPPPRALPPRGSRCGSGNSREMVR